MTNLEFDQYRSALIVTVKNRWLLACTKCLWCGAAPGALREFVFSIASAHFGPRCCIFTADRPPCPKSDFLLPTCRPRLILLVLHSCLDSESSSRQDRACVAASSNPKEAGMPRLHYEPPGRRADALVHRGRSACSVRHADAGEHLVREEKAAPVTQVLSRVVTMGPRAQPALPQCLITRVSYRAVEMVPCSCRTSSGGAAHTYVVHHPAATPL